MVSGELISHLLANSGNRIDHGLAAGLSVTDTINQLYRAALSRTPTAEESAALIEHVGRQANQRRGLEDVAWSLLNSNEFLFRR